jgi:D-glycero-D-manno-heptose 1,7-bisphosphate phosphatase
MPHHSLTAAIFLDKDGTLVENVPYNVDPALVQFTPGAIAGLQLLSRAGYPLFVVTNQSGLARGYFSEADLQGVEQHLRDQLAQADIPLQGIYACPHHPDGVVAAYRRACDCRKPQPGLLYQAAVDHGIDLTHSWMIGDILHDIEAGRAAGCRTILIDNGNETEWQLTCSRLPHHSVSNLWEAAQIILAVQHPNHFEKAPCYAQSSLS